MDTISLNQAGRKVVRSIHQQRAVFGSYGGGSLREYLWTVAAGAESFEAIAETMRLSKAQVSRITRTLHKRNYTGADGLDLIDVTFDLDNPRLKLVSLNKQGLKLLQDEWKTITGTRIEI